MPQKKIIAEGKFLRFIVEDNWEYVERTVAPSPVGIIAVTDDRKLLLIEQYRPPLKAYIIEIPAGLVGDHAGGADESLELAARRELREETGYEATHIAYVSLQPTSAGLTNETVRLVQARGLRKVHSGQLGDGQEQIRLIELPLSEARAWLTARAAEGRLIDPKVYVALWLVGG